MSKVTDLPLMGIIVNVYFSGYHGKELCAYRENTFKTGK